MESHLQFVEWVTELILTNDNTYKARFTRQMKIHKDDEILWKCNIKPYSTYHTTNEVYLLWLNYLEDESSNSNY